ncbi:MAG: HK97-gp10 family putative phage morphogenesis protein [Phyllobacterium sp.]
MARNNNLERLIKRMNAIPKQMRKAIKPQLDQSAEEMVRLARSVAPRDDGNLQRSIVYQDGPGELAVTVKAGGELTTREVRSGSNHYYDYALGQEFGTSEMPAQPYFWPAYRLTKKRIKGRISRAVSKAVKDFNNGK